MSRVRYLVRPGTIRSRTDGDIHYVGVLALVKLYDLRPGEWRVYDEDTDRRTDLTVLGPRYDGNYTLPAR